MEAARAATLTQPEASAPVVRLENVRFAWRKGSAPVLDIERFEIERGARVFLQGPSGSGKSTLLNLLGGVVVPERGRIEVLGTATDALGSARRDRFRADHIGYVFQLFNLLPYLSMIDNVTLPCRFSRRRRERAEARGGGVEREAERLLETLELGTGLRARPVTELSIGQQQRVAAARALIGAPELLIADEPTSSLDEGTRERFLELLFAECAASGATLLFVSHDARLGPLFDTTLSLARINRAGGEG